MMLSDPIKARTTPKHLKTDSTLPVEAIQPRVARHDFSTQMALAAK